MRETSQNDTEALTKELTPMQQKQTQNKTYCISLERV